jgi:hypothetical protein
VAEDGEVRQGEAVEASDGEALEEEGTVVLAEAIVAASEAVVVEAMLRTDVSVQGVSCGFVSLH